MTRETPVIGAIVPITQCTAKIADTTAVSA